MVSFKLASGIAMLATMASAVALPESGTLVTRQAQLPADCTDYCSVSAGCVCIRRPTNCQATYLVDADETCNTVVSHFNNFTAHDLYTWNPEIGRTCFGLRAYVPVCIGVSGYSYPGAVKGGDIWTADEVPVPIEPNIAANCTKFEYTDSVGSPRLEAILTQNSITREQWNTWNVPENDPSQEWAAWAGYFSCVKA